MVASEPEASIPFPEDLCVKEDEEEAADGQTWEEPINWSTETWKLATSWQVEQVLRRRCSKAVEKGSSHSPSWEGETRAEGFQNLAFIHICASFYTTVIYISSACISPCK
ncbi:hypothetical protein H8959_016617, partial [Pygathrix nigripes]